MKRVILFLTILFLVVGCSNNTDASKFKREYEKYNKEKINVKIDRDNIIKYKTSDEINGIIDKKSGVIFIGSSKDDLSRVAIEVLLKAADSTDLKEIYYVDSYKDIPKVKEINGMKRPAVIYVLDGEIIGYHIGTFDDLTKLDKKQEQELYNIYSDGIHSVLQDTCDEEC